MRWNGSDLGLNKNKVSRQAVSMERLLIIDSHTGGEPTRVIVEGGPELGGGTMAERLAILRDEHDEMRRAAIEPRGSDVMVGALWCEPSDAARPA